VTCGIVDQLRARAAPDTRLIRDKLVRSISPNLEKSILTAGGNAGSAAGVPASSST
jgi:hypothetical protein